MFKFLLIAVCSFHVLYAPMTFIRSLNQAWRHQWKSLISKQRVIFKYWWFHHLSSLFLWYYLQKCSKPPKSDNALVWEKQQLFSFYGYQANRRNKSPQEKEQSSSGVFLWYLYGDASIENTILAFHCSWQLQPISSQPLEYEELLCGVESLIYWLRKFAV